MTGTADTSARRASDSVVLGGISLVITAAALGLMYATRGAESTTDGPAMAVWCVAPHLALVNGFFVIRDFRKGRVNQAAVGLVLSAMTLFVALFPLLLAD